MTKHTSFTIKACLAFLALVTTVGLVSLTNPFSVSAQSEITLTAIPPRLGEDLDLTGAPGDTVQTSIKIVNETDTALPIQTSVQDFVVDENGSTPIPVTDETSSRWSLQGWMTASPEKQILQPGEAGTINLVINVPADALPGGHYAMVMHTPDLEPGTAQTQSKISQRVGTLVYFLVEGPINEEAFVRNFNFPFFSEYGPVPFSFTVENLSDIHIKPQTKIEIFNLLGKPVDTLVVPSKNIFPFVPRNIDGQWDRELGTGFYKATLTMSYGSSGQIIIAKTSFWLFPIRLVAIIALVILVIFVLFTVFRRTVVKRSQADRKRIKALEDELKKRS